MARRQGQAPFLGSETLAGFAAISLLLATFLSFAFDAIPKGASDTAPLPLSLFVIVIGLAPFIWVNVYRAGWRRKQTRLNQDFNEVVSEGRPFTLYLRPFVTSGRIKVPNDWPHFGQRMLLGDPWELEMALATVIGTDTPLVAIGDTRGGYGAAKLTTSDADWQAHMRRLSQQARLILAVPLDRPSTQWEMEEIQANGVLRDKTVFVMPPSSRVYDFLFFFFRRSVAARWRRSAKALKAKGLILPRYRHRGGLFLMGADGKPSKLAGFRNFRPAYIDALLDQVSMHAVQPADRIAWFNRTYGGTRWLRPRLFGGLSLMGLYTPNGIKRFVLFAIFYTLLITFVVEPRSIPSESMLPTLRVGDRVAVLHFAYGYTRSSPPFGIGYMLISDDPANPNQTLLGRTPRRGDIALFQHTHSDRVMIERVVGLPGDTVQMREGRLYLNGQMIERTGGRVVSYVASDRDRPVTAMEYREQLPGERQPHLIHEWSDQSDLDETPEFKVPPGRLFMMGDNRDNSEDSRAPSGHRTLATQFPEAWPYRPVNLNADLRDDAIGFVPLDHLIGRAGTVLFSLAGCKSPPGTECLSSNVWKPL